jgi:hypothetical protein
VIDLEDSLATGFSTSIIRILTIVSLYEISRDSYNLKLKFAVIKVEG